MQQTGTCIRVPQILCCLIGVGSPGGWPAALCLSPPTPPVVPSTSSAASSLSSGKLRLEGQWGLSRVWEVEWGGGLQGGGS